MARGGVTDVNTPEQQTKDRSESAILNCHP
jgi:hypothetical protein